MKILTRLGLQAPQATQTAWGQCGGQGWSGPTACASGSVCQFSSQYYSQCIPNGNGGGGGGGGGVPKFGQWLVPLILDSSLDFR